MLSDPASVESLPTTLLFVAPAISLLFTYLLLALALRLWGRSTATAAGVVGSDDRDPEPTDGTRTNNRSGVSGIGGEIVSCPDCGIENEAGYQFCRSCVSELPGSTLPSSMPSTPFLRGIN